MKPTYFTLLLCCLWVGSYGQATVKPGVRAGANFSQITRTHYHTRTDFYLGGYAEIRLNDFLRLQPEMGYSRQGARGHVYRLPQVGEPEPEGGKTWIRKDIETSYITAGMTTKLAFTESARFLLGVSGEYALEWFKPLRNDIDMAILIGAEYKLPFGLGLEVRIKRGVLDMIDSREYETYTSSRPRWFRFDRNLNLVLQTGLNFSLR